jgi:hypothetical protein
VCDIMEVNIIEFRGVTPTYLISIFDMVWYGGPQVTRPMDGFLVLTFISEGKGTPGQFCGIRIDRKDPSNNQKLLCFAL